MSDDRPAPGHVTWIDLTVDNAENVRDFYASVVGWNHSPVEMGGYSDFTMSSPDGAFSAGICHARGGNVGLPAQWLLYITVDDLDASVARCEKAGGSVVRAIKTMGQHGRYAVVQDPAGASVALFEPA